jgi:Cd2+/Zn2+-exporting ATPase
MELTKGQQILAEIEQERREIRRDAILTGITLLGLVTALLSTWLHGPLVLTIIAYAAAYLAGGLPASIEAFQELLNKKLDINLLMVLAALAALAVGEPRDGAILLFLFSLAGTLEAYAMGNTKRSIASLMELNPEKAHKKLEDGTTIEVSINELQPGDVIIVRPGERIATDGVITAGAGAIDQSSVTGESIPVERGIGDSVFAGTLNQNSVLSIQVSTKASDSTLARMIELVTQAQETKSPSERFSDWFGERYTIAVLVGSALALGILIALGLPFSEAAYKAATLLVVASPCAIVISVPAAVLSSLASAAKKGVLFKGGASLENLGNVKVIAFDKTGTLTHGKLEVTEIITLQGSQEELLSIAYTVESHSDHPLAKSIVAYASKNNITLKEEADTKMLAGLGIISQGNQGQQYWVGNQKLLRHLGIPESKEEESALQSINERGETPVLVGADSTILGVIGLADTVRESSKGALEKLRAGGTVKLLMLTGDTEHVAKAIGYQLGLKDDEIRFGLLPEDKVNIVKELQNKGNLLAFVGDGVNDAAALATANVGIAMGVSGSDVALEAADVAFLSEDLNQLGYGQKLSKKANGIIKQNLAFAVSIMLLMVVITIGWYLPLPLGVIGHEGGTLLVVANSLRLLFGKVTV